MIQLVEKTKLQIKPTFDVPPMKLISFVSEPLHGRLGHYAMISNLELKISVRDLTKVC